MIPVTTFAGKKVALFGLGASGLASASALLAGGVDVVAFDDIEGSVEKAHAAGIPTEDLRRIDWARISALVLAPGVPLTHPAPHWTVGLARNAAVEVIGDIELFCRERRRVAPHAPFIAITGTNGKSTTTALVAHLFTSANYDVQLGGNIGTAILSLEPPAPGRVHVIECSSFQIDLAPSLDPSIGILLNVTEDHLDRHGTIADYAAIKERLVAGVQRDGTAIVGVDDNLCQAVADRIGRAGDLADDVADGLFRLLRFDVDCDRGPTRGIHGGNVCPYRSSPGNNSTRVSRSAGSSSAVKSCSYCAASCRAFIRAERPCLVRCTALALRSFGWG